LKKRRGRIMTENKTLIETLDELKEHFGVKE